MANDPRQQVEKQFGKELATKATEAFCRRFGGGGPDAVYLESADQPGEDGVIVEFDDPVEKPTTQPLATPEVQSRIRAALREIARPQDTLSALRLLQLGVDRENFELQTQTLRVAVEKRTPSYGLETALHAAIPRTEICWLNRTMRVRRGPRALAEIAADPAIRAIDLPRRLQSELDRTNKVVGAAAYRATHSRSGANIIVAVIDSEVFAGHTAFGQRVIHKHNFTNEPWGKPDNHGTAVAGIVGGVHDPVTGMAPSVTIYNYKVLATNPWLNADDFGGALAIQRALEDGAHIANCSWGVGPAGSGDSREAIACNRAWDLGLIIVKSAGNLGPNPGTMTSPADARGVIVVAATDVGGTTLPDYSSRGPIPTKSGPDLAAPGGTRVVPLNSALSAGTVGACGNGTSFAAPHVSGIIALMLEGNPELMPEDVRNRLRAACAPIAGVNADSQGAGVISMVRLGP